MNSDIINENLFGLDLFGDPIHQASYGVLSDKFLFPPFSVLDARNGKWQERKRAWISLGIQSELGRDGARTFGQDIMKGEWEGQTKHNYRQEADRRSNINKACKKPDWATGTGTENMAVGTSIFDPVLCEVLYNWFCPESGTIIDPFAGGSVRGIVASLLGRQYYGIDLSKSQIAANYEQSEKICNDYFPVWHNDDSVNIGDILDVVRVDFIFSCPPYYDLEVYSDDNRDLSNMSFNQFEEKYRAIIQHSVDMLKPNRFACFVVGDIRDKAGYYRKLPNITTDAFESAGALLYNEALLITAVGSLPIRINRQFTAGRKLGKTHQNILIFCKGDWRKAVKELQHKDEY